MPSLLSKGSRSQLVKIGWITVAWTTISLFIFFIGYATILNNSFVISKKVLLAHFISSIFTGLLAGVLGGSTLVLLWKKWLRSKPYGWTIKSILLTYSVIFVLVAFPSAIYFSVNRLHLSVFDIQVWQIALNQLIDISTLEPIFTWLFIVVFTLIFLLVNDMYGPGIFKKFLLGQYFHPQREERIFMFLDLRSSTSIAEKLGEKRYFNFLRDVFKYATPSIVKAKGEIYQYVGDEIVISWKTEVGIKMANCIHCFFNIQTALVNNSSHFEFNYNTKPEFKAGLHYGYVMAGEIGLVKRDIAFSGDVLNTTARIQTKCNELGVNILISEILKERLNLDSNLFSARRLGMIELRGKEQHMALYTM